MKTKKTVKPLVIKKETIARIDDSNMNAMKGGMTANTCWRTCLNTCICSIFIC
jgi:hypothetical protein